MLLGDGMKICIYGAGAIGGYLGVQLARAGADVSLVARGAHLAAMREQRPELLTGEEERTVHPRCTDNAAELGAAGLRHRHAEGAFDHRRDREDAAAARAAHPHRHRGQRHPLLVFPQARRRLRELDAGEHRSRRPAMARARRRTRHRLHRLSRHRDRGARRDPPRLRQ